MVVKSLVYRFARRTLPLALLLSATGCVIVPQNRRAALSDPLMQLDPDGTEAYRKTKFYSTREAAAGGDGTPAGGGCGCQ